MQLVNVGRLEEVPPAAYTPQPVSEAVFRTTVQCEAAPPVRLAAIPPPRAARLPSKREPLTRPPYEKQTPPPFSEAELFRMRQLDAELPLS